MLKKQFFFSKRSPLTDTRETGGTTTRIACAPPVVVAARRLLCFRHSRSKLRAIRFKPSSIGPPLRASPRAEELVDSIQQRQRLLLLETRKFQVFSGDDLLIIIIRPNAQAYARGRAVWLCLSYDPQPDVVRDMYPWTAMCVRNVDVHVSCSSQVDAQLAAFFIDPRAK